MASVICVGSTMMDMVTYVKRAPGPGETIVGERFALGFGGKGANQAVMARLLGSEVAMVNCLGDDANGASYRKRFEELGINVDHVHTASGVASGCAPIWVEADGQNRIIVVPGANHSLTPDQATAAAESLPARVCFGQFEIPQRVTAAAFSAAKKRGVVTVLNPAPAEQIEKDLLAATDWIIPNESEFALLSRGELSDEPVTDDAIIAFATKLGVRLLVTLGASGVALVDAACTTVTRLPAPPTGKVVDTTGAGDAFVGGFCHGLARGLDEVTACKLGMACASDSVTREGTQASFPDNEQCKQICSALGIAN
eukprot:TRINITY_DN46140_c0_g1_i1.p1 TRINITY_DN46140_c0_g1~~TRINITY_DN46140_c0_g1_i1.p1  ORF type:complete len:339 (-),score=62.70 TRINITY_DN46140_c0_g1_i1:314-1249(-)